MLHGITRKETFWTISSFLFLAFFPLALALAEETLYAYGSFASGIVILEIKKALGRNRIAKLAALGLYLMGTTAFIEGFDARSFAAPLYTIAMLAILRLAAAGGTSGAPAAGKPRLSLFERGLSPSETAYVKAAMRGIPYKEIASDAGVSESTVRNTLARAYHKLGVVDKAGLVALIDAHELVD